MTQFVKRLHGENVHARVFQGCGADEQLMALMLAWARTGDYDAIPTEAEQERARSYARQNGFNLAGLLKDDPEGEEVAGEFFYRFYHSLFSEKPDCPLWVKTNNQTWKDIR